MLLSPLHYWAIPPRISNPAKSALPHHFGISFSLRKKQGFPELTPLPLLCMMRPIHHCSTANRTFPSRTVDPDAEAHADALLLALMKVCLRFFFSILHDILEGEVVKDN